MELQCYRTNIKHTFIEDIWNLSILKAIKPYVFKSSHGDTFLYMHYRDKIKCFFVVVYFIFDFAPQSIRYPAREAALVHAGALLEHSGLVLRMRVYFRQWKESPLRCQDPIYLYTLFSGNSIKCLSDCKYKCTSTETH